MVLIGNKCDLEEKRDVTVAEGKDLAKSFNCLHFEASAKRRYGVEEAFYGLVGEIRNFSRRDSDAFTKKQKKPKNLLKSKQCLVL